MATKMCDSLTKDYSGPSANCPICHLAPPFERVERERGWVIESRSVLTGRLRYFGGAGWSDNHQYALRFARRYDADSMRAIHGFTDAVSVERVWTGAPPPSTVSESATNREWFPTQPPSGDLEKAMAPYWQEDGSLKVPGSKLDSAPILYDAMCRATGLPLLKRAAPSPAGEAAQPNFHELLMMTKDAQKVAADFWKVETDIEAAGFYRGQSVAYGKIVEALELRIRATKSSAGEAATDTPKHTCGDNGTRHQSCSGCHIEAIIKIVAGIQSGISPAVSHASSAADLWMAYTSERAQHLAWRKRGDEAEAREATLTNDRDEARAGLAHLYACEECADGDAYCSKGSQHLERMQKWSVLKRLKTP